MSGDRDIVEIIRSIHQRSERGRCTACRGPFESCLPSRAADEIEALRARLAPCGARLEWPTETFVCVLPLGHPGDHAHAPTERSPYGGNWRNDSLCPPDPEGAAERAAAS